MNLTNFKLIWRNLVKNSGITTINVIGLSVSFAVSTLIILFLQFEYSFDQSNPASKDCYRLLTTFKYPNSPESLTARASSMMGPHLKLASPDVENYLRVVNDNEDFLCRANGREVTIGRNLQVDSTFFDFFNFPLLHGDKKTVFDKLENILITRPVSEKLFGTENPVGNTLDYSYSLASGKDTTVQYIIAAVFDNLPANSHLQFESIMPYDKRQFDAYDEHSRWHMITTTTYLQLRPTAKDESKVAASFPTFLEGRMANHEMIGLDLQPFSQIHLDSKNINYDFDNHQKSDRKYLQVFGLIALFIVLISSINFANLSTVLAMRRVREVGVRKSLGANKSDLLKQFLGEAILMSVIGGGLALVWVFFLQQPFLDLLGRNIEFNYSPTMFVIYVAATILLGIIAGIFPAIQAAKYSAVEAFSKLGTAVSVKRPFIQRLVVLQFIMSAVLIIGSLICYHQLNYLQTKDLGFKYDQIVELHIGQNNTQKSIALQKELASISGVIGVTESQGSLGEIQGQQGLMVRNETTQEPENFPMTIQTVAPNYFDLFKMEFVEGRAPTTESAVNGQEFVVNESFIKRVGWKENPLNKEIMTWVNGNTTGRVVGVIKDIHHNTLHNPIEAICFQVSQELPVISIKVNEANVSKVLSQTEVLWNKHIKDSPFDYRFMDAHLSELYASESRLGQILLLATILSILIACLGLLALSAFIIQQRMKEIGIRKVLGASTVGLIGLLSKDFLKLVFIAFLIATPFAWYVMDTWLNNFAYRIDIQWWTFAIAGIASLTIAFITVGSQSLKAALGNPVDSIKTE